MASVEKMFRLMLDELQQSNTLLRQVVQNQDIMIIQHKQLVELLQAPASRTESNGSN